MSATDGAQRLRLQTAADSYRPLRGGAGGAQNSSTAATEILLSEVGPQLWRDVHLSVGSLPKQEVRQAHFAGSANKEIRSG